MALHRTPVALGAVTALILLAGCDNLSFRRLDFDATEAVRITDIRVLPGAGDVVVRATGEAGKVRIKRVVRYQGGEPDQTYEISGSELVLDTECGQECTVSYDVTAPPGVNVRGETGSGNVDLSKVGAVDVELGSGDLRITAPTGPVHAETGSGSVEVDDATEAVVLRVSSGDITARRARGTVDAEAQSGRVTVHLATVTSARVHASSGDVELVVPAGAYQVRSTARSGEANLGVPHTPAAAAVLDVATGSGDITVSQR
ncbi:DUF4097 family beta strand repeat-containing protein [Micromonospora endolithica]|uniref:DUF4097 domain-containing protein n=1 Tax=Micromonospora endolithica TaxID=230091 RepID=A0A3A9Z4D5_9ACTN|nr:DUF4097 family beta strand repeat-containing protein [Micromonospora endolithica]RKN42674.1 hypothetical protein D7223_21780 [Micromonospora endolithica]TWJ20054.1 putative adhesin [Micromonospora endolithica]